MKKPLLIFIAVAFLTIQSFSQCADPANIYTFTYNGKNYEVVKEMKNWVDACSCAVERGGYLVEINNNNEQNAVYDSLINGAGVLPTYTSIANGGGIAYVWIGATDQLTEGEWLWDGDNDGVGTHFWDGQGANGAGNGMPVGNAFNYWGGYNTFNYMEPDNYGAGQNHAAIGLAGWPSGTTMLGAPGEWNDIIGTSMLYFIIELDASTGILDDNFKNPFEIYPNPASEKIIIKNSHPIHSVEISDLNGKLLFMELFHQQNTVEINTSTLNSGVYFIRISDGVNIFYDKIILK